MTRLNCRNRIEFVYWLGPSQYTNSILGYAVLKGSMIKSCVLKGSSISSLVFDCFWEQNLNIFLIASPSVIIRLEFQPFSRRTLVITYAMETATRLTGHVDVVFMVSVFCYFRKSSDTPFYDCRVLMI